MEEYESERVFSVTRMILSLHYDAESIEIIMNPPDISTFPEEDHDALNTVYLIRDRAMHEAMRILGFLFPANQSKPDYEELFNECAAARDGVGFIGTVPECIAWQEARYQILAKCFHLFYAYVNENATRWKTSGWYNHPLWALVKTELEPYGKIESESLEGAFIKGDNRLSLDRLAAARAAAANFGANLDDEIPF